VTATGAATEMGKIGALIDAANNDDTPLEKKLAGLGRLLLVIVLALCAVIVVAGWLRGHSLLFMLEVGISLAIAAVPEGLPAVATMTLAIGMQRMSRMGALVRRLPAVETLGSTTVICTDKTGTLTRNEMTVSAFVLDARRVDVSGAGYSPVGTHRDGGEDAVLGDPTEAALIVAAEKAGFSEDTLEAEFPRVREQPFDSATKRMATVHQTPEGGLVMFVKGAPATLLAASSSQVRAGGVAPLTPDDRARWSALNQGLAGAALRALALAYRDLPEGAGGDDDDATDQLVFVGLVAMTDPLREEAIAAIATCRAAGIRSVMITGDQEITAAEIARQLGIDRDLDGQPLRIVNARELADLDAAGWQAAVKGAAVFARVSPKHKLQIVGALQAQGQVVAMTGDGVNDAPALKKADIGIAMGIKGTEVVKETAHMVIVDDNFATIVRAVEQGRIIYANILRFIRYLFSCNLAELLTVFAALMVGWPLPLAALQILWLNKTRGPDSGLGLAGPASHCSCRTPAIPCGSTGSDATSWALPSLGQPASAPLSARPSARSPYLARLFWLGSGPARSPLPYALRGRSSPSRGHGLRRSPRASRCSPCDRTERERSPPRTWLKGSSRRYEALCQRPRRRRVRCDARASSWASASAPGPPRHGTGGPTPPVSFRARSPP